MRSRDVRNSVSVHFRAFLTSVSVSVEKVTEIRKYYHKRVDPVPQFCKNFSKLLLRNHLKFDFFFEFEDQNSFEITHFLL